MATSKVPAYALKSEQALIAWAVKLLKCDVGRITEPYETTAVRFFIAGEKRTTQQDTAETGCIWVDETGKVKNWKYVAEKTVACGNDLAGLATSILNYANALDKTMLDALVEALDADGKKIAAKAYRKAAKTLKYVDGFKPVDPAWANYQEF